DATSPTPAGIAHTRRRELRARPRRATARYAWRMRTPARPGRNGCCSSPRSWLLSFRRQRLPQLVQAGTDSCLDRAERLIQPRRHLGMRQFGEERRLDRLSLERREDRERVSQRAALLLELENSAAVVRLDRRQWIAHLRLDALLPLLEAQPVDGPGARLVHDPSEDGAVRSVVAGCSPPHIVKHVE